MNLEDSFNRTKERHCKGWSEKSLKMAYLSIVKGMRAPDVAREVEGDRNAVYVMRKRFQELMQRDSVVKVPLDAFIAAVPPAAHPLQPFRSDIQKLDSKGYSVEQIQEFLRQNDLEIDTDSIRNFLTNSDHGGNP